MAATRPPPTFPRTCNTTIRAHTGNIACLRVDATGEYLMSGGADKTIRLWNTGSSAMVKAYAGHGWEVLGSYDASVRLWDTKSQSTRPIQTLSEAKDSVASVAIREHEIATGSIDGHVRRYDLRMGLFIVDCVGSPATCVSFTSDGNCLLVSSLDSTIRLFDKENGELLTKCASQVADLYSIGSEDGSVRIWDLVEGQELARLDGHKGAVMAAAWHAAEPVLFTGALDGIIRRWD
ncbi:WD repeat-containing protein 83 [Sorochytrium milnesiophthora]